MTRKYEIDRTKGMEGAGPSAPAASPAITMARDVLLKPIDAVKGIASGKGVMPILGNVLVELGKVSIVKATDLSLSAIRTMAYSHPVRARFLLPAALAADVLGKLDSAEIEVTLEPGEAITIKQGRGVYKFPWLDPEDFPAIDLILATPAATMPGGDLKAAIEHTAYALGTDETRYLLTGLNLVIEDGVMIATATSGFRGAQYKKALPANQAAPEVVIPRSTLKAIEAMIADEESVDIVMSAKKIQFATVSTTLVSGILAGSFPDLAGAIPEKSEYPAIIDKDQLARALKRVGRMAIHNEPLRVQLADKACVLSVTSEGGEAQEAVDCDYEGPSYAFNLQIRFLPEVIARLAGHSVDIALPKAAMDGKGGGAIVIREDDFVNLMMPLML